VVDARPAHHDGFPNRGCTNANRSRVYLQPRQFGALLTLDMWPERCPSRGQVLSHERNVLPDTVEIHDQGRRDKFPARPADRRTIDSTNMIAPFVDHTDRLRRRSMPRFFKAYPGLFHICGGTFLVP